jgi:hypothetical protein
MLRRLLRRVLRLRLAGDISGIWLEGQLWTNPHISLTRGWARFVDDSPDTPKIDDPGFVIRVVDSGTPKIEFVVRPADTHHPHQKHHPLHPHNPYVP